MNEGDAPYLRARAQKYRQVAGKTDDAAAAEQLNRIAAEYESDAQSIAGDGERPAGPGQSEREARRSAG